MVEKVEIKYPCGYEFKYEGDYVFTMFSEKDIEANKCPLHGKKCVASNGDNE